MKYFCLILIMMESFAVHAEVEVSLAPILPISYESKYGTVTRVEAAVGYFLNRHVELQLGGIFGVRSQSSERLTGIYAGALYNFSKDHLRSYVAGTRVGYVNHYSWVVYDPEDPSSTYVSVSSGKRFLLSEDYKVTWFPYVEVIYGARSGDQQFSGQINIFNFSMVF